ncbi:DUF1381 domain-containing protein [Staphylococcus hominis]|uniref:DUF1381 domain-containing protein n=1 Tax=Staphylococcus hominis TaxID=1290 RepID=UPI000D1DE288|nr:DUF1381 domain-containing protein [Staphylococcus hominis]PTK37712.1 hypothetical protein BUZ45_03155 [Staphylococcus hominis]
MKQYVVIERSHKTGEIFRDIMPLRDNESILIVEAENIEQSKKEYKSYEQTKGYNKF